YVFQAACNYYEDEPQDTKIGITHNFIHEAVNNKGVESNEKTQKMRKTNILYGFVFTKPESINEHTRFLLGSVANRYLFTRLKLGFWGIAKQEEGFILAIPTCLSYFIQL
ncbi:hypothetical protein MXB_470, partial [Myxobolus squamalis]